MTADLELWLRGLFVHPNRCHHSILFIGHDLPTGDSLYRCVNCGRVARLSEEEVSDLRSSSRLSLLPHLVFT